MPGSRNDWLRHLQTLYAARNTDRRTVRHGRKRRHGHVRQHGLAGGIYRSAVAGAHRGGARQQHRFAIGPLANERGRSSAQVGSAGLSAVIQLRAPRFDQQFRQQPGKQGLHHSGHGKLADRHLQLADQCQAQVEGGLCPEQGIPPSRPRTTDRQRSEPLLHAIDAR